MNAPKDPEVSRTDIQYYNLIRSNVNRFLTEQGRTLDSEGIRLLDIAPQDHEGAAPHFPLSTVATLDLDPNSGADFIADLCQTNDDLLPDASYDVVVCTEVLEHTRNPFLAVAEIGRLLCPGGKALVSTPFNFRIHGPLPDNWRFSEHGLRQLFSDFASVSIEELPAPERFLAPIHYTAVAVA